MAHEKEDPRNLLILTVGLVSFATIVAVMLGLASYYDRLRDHEQQVKVLGVDNPELVALRAEEQRKQTTYAKVVEKDKPVRYRIPIDQAISTLAKRGRDGIPSIQPDPNNAYVNGPPPAPPASSAPLPEDKKDDKKKDEKKADKKEQK